MEVTFDKNPGTKNQDSFEGDVYSEGSRIKLQKHIKESYTSNEDNQLYLFFFLILPLTLRDYGFYIWEKKKKKKKRKINLYCTNTWYVRASI